MRAVDSVVQAFKTVEPARINQQMRPHEHSVMSKRVDSAAGCNRAP
jgi:hypothetical protein